MKRRVAFIFLFVGISGIIHVSAQSKMTRQEYIQKYKDLAIEEMARTGIPASITMAQGLLESGDGNSRLAVKANNHFGIKCHDWDGRKLRHDDDARRECFRRYKSAEDSYRDHSDFLTSTSRYTSLFKLSPTDYKQWAIGLKKAGYATSPTYADALIKIIEENKLYLLDEGVDVPDTKNFLAKNSKPSSTKNLKQTSSKDIIGNQRNVLENNRVKYIIAKEGDSYNNLTDEMEMLPWQLAKYNELPVGFPVTDGQVIYIQPKRVNAEQGHSVHKVTEGETMFSISQKYAVKLDKLYSRNQMEPGTEPRVGDNLLLRGKGKRMKKITPALVREKKEDEPELKFEFDPE